MHVCLLDLDGALDRAAGIKHPDAHLKFNVEDRGAVNDGNERLEDLRVSDPDEPAWQAIVEVRDARRLRADDSPGDLSTPTAAHSNLEPVRLVPHERHDPVPLLRWKALP